LPAVLPAQAESEAAVAAISAARAIRVVKVYNGVLAERQVKP
jgi:hypothetical protein